MSVQKILFVLAILVISVSQFFVPIAFTDASENQAASALATTEESVVSAYQAVSKAEEAGANVSSLLIRLNEAGWLLALAQVEYKSGDFDSTLEFAAHSQEKLNGFVAAADALRETAIQERFRGFLVNAGSIIGAIGVVCVSFLVWFLLKRKYEKAGSAV